MHAQPAAWVVTFDTSRGQHACLSLLSTAHVMVCCLLLSCRMSDLLLPFLLLMDDDALAFWCFVSLMQRMGARHNFAVDERGIFGQLRLLFQVGSAAHHSTAQRGTHWRLRQDTCSQQRVNHTWHAHGSTATVAVVDACVLAGAGVQ